MPRAKSPSVNARALVLLAGAQLAIGAAAIFARFALTSAGPFTVSALRLAIGAAPLVVFAVSRRRYAVIDGSSERRLFVAGIVLAVHFATWIASLRYASVTVSTLLVCSTPIFTEAYAVIRSRRIRPLTLTSIAVALAGVAIVTGVPNRTETPLGIALALAGAVAIGAYILIVRATDPRYDTLAIVARTYPIAAVALTLAALATHDGFPASSAGVAWAGILAMALVSQLFGHTAITAVVRLFSATFIATATLIEPVIAAIAAAIVFNERLSAATFAGATLIFAAIAVSIYAEATQARGSVTV